MKKTLIALTTALSLGAIQASAQQPMEWLCYDQHDYFMRGEPLIRAVVDERKQGILHVTGIEKYAQYTVQGLDHRWDADATEDGRFQTAFVITPSRGGALYNFRAAYEIAGTRRAYPEMVTLCRKTR